MARSIEGSSRCSASAEDVWPLWTDPTQWLGGPIEAAEVYGPFEVGSQYMAKVRGYSPFKGTITRVQPPRLWAGVSKRPGLTMTVEHVIEPRDDGTLLTERLIMTGPLAPVVALVLGRRLKAVYEQTTAHGARVAEGHAKA